MKASRIGLTLTLWGMIFLAIGLIGNSFWTEYQLRQTIAQSQIKYAQHGRDLVGLLPQVGNDATVVEVYLGIPNDGAVKTYIYRGNEFTMTDISLAKGSYPLWAIYRTPSGYVETQPVQVSIY